MNASDLNLISDNGAGYSHVATIGNLEGVRRRIGDDQPHPMAAVLGQQWTSKRVLLDLGKTDYLDSTAIGWLIATNKAFKSDGGKLVIHSVTGRVKQIFKMLNLNSVIPQADDETAGSKMLLGAPQ